MKKNKATFAFITAVLITILGFATGQPAFIGAAVTTVNQYYDLQEVEAQ